MWALRHVNDTSAVEALLTGLVDDDLDVRLAARAPWVIVRTAALSLL